MFVYHRTTYMEILMEHFKTFAQALSESKLSHEDHLIGQVKDYFEDVWTKENGTKRQIVKGIKARDSYGFIVGKRAFFVNATQHSKIGNVIVYRSTDENNDHLVIYVDDQGNLYADSKQDVKSLKALIK